MLQRVRVWRPHRRAPTQSSPGGDVPQVEEGRRGREEPGQERHHGRELVPLAQPGGAVGSVELEEDVDDGGARAGGRQRQYRQHLEIYFMFSKLLIALVRLK